MDNENYDVPLRSPGGIAEVPHYFPEEIVVYVEGKKDKTFLYYVLEQMDLKNFKLFPVRGKGNLKRHFKSITDLNAQIIVITDSDYESWSENPRIPDDPRIVLIPAHSAENILYSSAVVESIIQVRSSSPDEEFRTDFEEWREKTFNKFTNLIILDAINDIYNQNVKVIHIDYNLYTYDGINACDIKIKDAEIVIPISLRMATRTLAGIAEEPNKYQIIRGHFYETAVLEYIKSKIYKPDNYDCDLLYGDAVLLVRHNSRLLDNIDELESRILKALAALSLSLPKRCA